MNNIMHLKYALEVEKTGSITKAAENLFMGQPHLSKAIRELEDSIGIAIFNRTSKGVVPTKKGAEFLCYARNILKQIEEMEALYKPAAALPGKFDISVPRASYIAYAFLQYVKSLQESEVIDINYRETNSVRAIKNVSDSANNIAIVRYQNIYEKYFLSALKERELEHESVCEFEYLALMSAENPLANKSEVLCAELEGCTEIIHGDFSIPALPLSQIKDISAAQSGKKRIAVYERASQLELLSSLPSTFMWVSPMPPDVLKRFDLVQKRCDKARNKYKDILIFRKGYRLNESEKEFYAKLKQAVEHIMKNMEF